MRAHDRDPRPASVTTEESAAAPQLRDLVIITGFSGAGKSTAMNVFEDAGYFCVDNLPPEMIAALVELFRHEGSKVERAAVVSDVRGGEYFEALQRRPRRPRHARDAASRCCSSRRPSRPLSLDTRKRGGGIRSHPRGSVADGVAAERALLAGVRERADVVIDTTGMSAATLRNRIAERVRRAPGRGAPVGHVHELRLQARPAARRRPRIRRALPVQSALRARSASADRARRRPSSSTSPATVAWTTFYERLHPLLDFLLDQYVEEGKAHLVIAIGCTGGRHRSVAISEHLAERYRDRDDLTVAVSHRDIEKGSSGA